MDGREMGFRTLLKLWVPVAVVGLIVIALAYYYAIGATESQGASSYSLANFVGLILVVVGVVAAGLVMRRATPHQ
jgi:uncharacterized membrane protein YidH (DUF202 family)